MPISRRARLSLRAVALLYLFCSCWLPVAVVFVKTFEHGFGVAWGYMTTPAAISALSLSLLMAVIAVPLNTVFGIGARAGHRAPPRARRAVLDALIDLPFLVSPVIVGLALTLVYGIHGWFGTWFSDQGIAHHLRRSRAWPWPRCSSRCRSSCARWRPVLVEVGDEQEQAAATLGASAWQTFWRITLPSIRWGVAYGVILSTARALGEIGAVLVVSSLVAGSTLTLPLLVYQRDSQLGASSITGAYAAATELAVISLVVLLVMTALSPRRHESR